MQLHKLIHNLAGCDLDRTPYVANWRELARADFDLAGALIFFGEAENKNYDAHTQAKFSARGTLVYDDAISAIKRGLGVL